MPLRSRQRQQIGKERHIVVTRLSASEQGFQLLQLGRGLVFTREFGCVPELVEKRMERAVLVIR